ncbi:MAG: HAMP domain-containing histidine kinase [Clostridia bacterium]|nr:HAMP domain-containing histidine kinase [Clostridia bacterium]
MREKNRQKKVKRTLSIRWKLGFYLSAFAILVLAVTWLFQVFLLSSFFRIIKKDELKQSAHELAAVVGEASMETLAYRAAQDHTIGVTVYRLDPAGGSAPVFSIDPSGNPMPIAFSRERLNEYYQRALQEDGYFCTRFSLGNYEEEKLSFWEQLIQNDKNFQSESIQKSTRFISVQLAQNPNTGEQYMLVLTAALYPLVGTVQILKMQYTWILAVVLIITIFTVLFMYQRISKPIIQMTNSAKELARGNYNAEFSGDDFLETRELADTLNYASEELSRVDKLQKELIANISHDLRTPLTMVKGYAEVMRDIPGENTPENLQLIVDETEHLSSLVNDLLDLSRIQSGSRSLEMSVFDITEAVREVLTRYEAFTKHQGYCISFECEQNVTVYADRYMTLQVIYNLINNAIHYTGEDKLVLVRQTVLDDQVRISVTDSGSGIPKEEQAHIWESYYRGQKSHRRAIIGSGLGLSIVKEVLEKHSANYGLSSELGKGSCFWFELPIHYPDCSNTVVDVTTDFIEEG